MPSQASDSTLPCCSLIRENAIRSDPALIYSPLSTPVTFLRIPGANTVPMAQKNLVRFISRYLADEKEDAETGHDFLERVHAEAAGRGSGQLRALSHKRRRQQRCAKGGNQRCHQRRHDRQALTDHPTGPDGLHDESTSHTLTAAEGAPHPVHVGHPVARAPRPRLNTEL
jgi:hypothetical protein